MSCPGTDLRSNILKYDFPRNYKKASVVDRWNRTMRAEMYAAPTCLDVTGYTVLTVILEVSILFKRRQFVTARNSEG